MIMLNLLSNWRRGYWAPRPSGVDLKVLPESHHWVNPLPNGSYHGGSSYPLDSLMR
jgi:hypothetical protein